MKHNITAEQTTTHLGGIPLLKGGLGTSWGWRGGSHSSPYTIYIDEAGRWPLAGPVVVGCVMQLAATDLSQYHDSKQLSESRRERVFGVLQAEKNLIRSTWSTSASLIDRRGIVWALRSAIIKALKSLYSQCVARSGFVGSFAIFCSKIQIKLDGNSDFWLRQYYKLSVETIIKGDALVPLIGAASIAAKVTRDRHMIRLAKRYPEYGFDRHKGYGTRAHIDAIQQYGLCKEHRASRVK